MESFFTKKKIEENMQDKAKKFKLVGLGKDFPTISSKSKEFINLVKQEKSKRNSPLSVAEVGVGIGASAVEIYKILGTGDKYYCFDFDYVIKALIHDLGLLKEESSGCDVIPVGNTEKTYDSYNWSLSKLLLEMRNNKQDGMFDIIYLDGAHTFFHDGLACCMLKEMCTVGGYIILDDIGWSHAKSPTQNLVELASHYTREQLEDCQVRRVEQVFFSNDSMFKKVSQEGEWRAVYKKEPGDLSELRWSRIFHDTIIGSEWFFDQALAHGWERRLAVGYNFLYALYRILDEMHPKSVLEIGLGQSTKLTGQYARRFGASHTVVEHDREWTDFFLHGWKKLSRQTRICLMPLVEAEFAGQKYFAYRDFDKVISSMQVPCELIVVDGPFGGHSERSRRDIVPYLPQLLAEDFVIMIDDCGRKGEENLVQEIRGILNEHRIEHAYGLYKSGGNCHVGVIACKKWRFFTSM